MALWRIYAVADPSDGRWQGRKIWKEVIVRAPSAAMARLIASKLEASAESHGTGAHNAADWSGFTDEKLYWVQRLDAEHEATLETGGNSDEVISATVLKD